MVTCAFCNKMINVVLGPSGQYVDTKYWREDNPRIYFCDGYCATGLHEQERNDRRRKDREA